MLSVRNGDLTPEAPPPLEARAPSRKPSAEAPKRTRIPRLPLSTGACFGLSALWVAFAFALAGLGVPPRVVLLLWFTGLALFALSTLTALYRAARGIVDLVYPGWGRAAGRAPASLGAILGNLFMTGFGMLIAYFATVGFARGRQLRRFGRVLLPRLRSNPAWAGSTLRVDGPAAPPSQVADQWRENGKTEHASVAAFARLTLDLMALGAPPPLIAAANRDALDEIRHTELCFSLARAIDGNSVSPGPFPQAQRVATLPRSRTLALAKIAVDSLVDGALHEGVSARVIAKLARRCEVPAIRSGLKEIAADEGRHAAHGWAVVEWCLDEGGRPVGQALVGAIHALPKEMRSVLPEPASDGGWERWGIHGHALEAEQYASALDHLTERVHATVAAMSSAAPTRSAGRPSDPRGWPATPGPALPPRPPP